MDKLTNTLLDRLVLTIASFGLLFAVIPASYIFPVDWAVETITGKTYVDVTIGLITYIFFLGFLAFITVSYAISLSIKAKTLTKLSITLFTFLGFQIVAILVYSGVF